MNPNEWSTTELDAIDRTISAEDRSLLAQMKKNREEQAGEPLRPVYHFTAPIGGMNDPNGFCRWKGNLHLFYQNNCGNGWFWGHAVSKDGLHWMDLPFAILPEQEKECWSGMVLIEEERAIAAYYGLNTGIMLAVCEDPMLLHWKKLNGGAPVIPSVSKSPETQQYIAFDPCIWKKGEIYCLLSGKYTVNPHTGTRERQEYLFESADLLHWDYKGIFLENDLYAVPDDDGACPYFLPCGNRHVLLHFSHHSGPKILVGDYDTVRNRLIVTNGRHLTSTSSFFGGLLAPSAFADEDGSLCLIHNITHCGNPNAAYQVMSLPRRVTLSGEKQNDIAIDVSERITSLRVPESHVEEQEITLEANRAYSLGTPLGDTAELILECEAKNVPMLEIKVMMSEDGEEYSAVRVFRQRGNTYLPAFAPGFGYRKAHETVVQLDTTRSAKRGNVRVPDEQSFYLKPDEKLRIRVFLDRSVIEVFVNGVVAMAARVSPVSGNNTRASVTSYGDDLTLCKWESYRLSL